MTNVSKKGEGTRPQLSQDDNAGSDILVRAGSHRHLSDLLERAARNELEIFGADLLALREELGRRVSKKRGGRPGVSQRELARVMADAGLSGALTERVIGSREQKHGPICVVCADTFAKTFALLEEKYGLRIESAARDKKEDLERFDPPRYCYSKLSTMDILAVDEGYPRVDELAFDAVVFRPDQRRLESLMSHAVFADRHGNSVSNERDEVLALKDELAVSISIRLASLKLAPPRVRRPLTLNHFGNDRSLWLLANGQFGDGNDASNSIPCQDDTSETMHFRRGIRVKEKEGGCPELDCAPVNSPWLASGSLYYVINHGLATDVAIRIVVLGAFDKAREMVSCAGVPMTVLANHAHIAVAFDKSVNKGVAPKGLLFQAYPDTRVHRGPETVTPNEPVWRAAADDSRLIGQRAFMSGRRVTIARPHLGEVYGFTWPALK